MDKITWGIIAILILSAMQITAWILNKDGAISSTIFSLIGLIAGSIFGFSLGRHEDEK